MFFENPNQQCFRFCPACGAQSLGAASIKSFQCRQCGFVFFLNCAAAAMAIILDNRIEENQFKGQDRMLVTVRAQDPGKGSLDLPGGFAEPGENIVQSLVREVKEELNLDISKVTFFSSYPNTYPYKSVAYPVTDMAFTCRVKDFSPIRAMDDVASFQFIPVRELDPSQFGMASARKIIAQFKNSYFY